MVRALQNIVRELCNALTIAIFGGRTLNIILYEFKS